MAGTGGKREGAGRPEGSKNKKTEEWEQLGDFLTEEGAERAKGIMRDAQDNAFMRYYTMLLEYFRPKHQRSEVKQETTIKMIDGFEYKVPDETDSKTNT